MTGITCRECGRKPVARPGDCCRECTKAIAAALEAARKGSSE